MSRAVILPRPHASQAAVLASRRRYNVLCCGRRWGKTTIAMDCIVRQCLPPNGQRGKGRPVAWFAPTYRLLSDAWRQLEYALDPIILSSKTCERMELRGGGSIDGWSLDKPDAGRGRAYAAAVVDEAALIKDLERAWQQSIRPMLNDYQGEAWFLSTPKGIANYFHSLYQLGQSERASWASWQKPTRENPFIRPEEIEAAREDLTDLAFAQEYLAQFVSWAGAVFRRIQDAIQPITLEPAAMIGVDWGRTGDSTVFTALSAAGHLVASDRFRGIEYVMQRQRLKEFWVRNGARCWIVAENNSIGGPVVEQLRADGLPVVGFNTTSVSKASIIQGLALAFERNVIRIPNDPVLIGELQAFEGKPSPSGATRYGAPAGIHDDCVMSLAIAWAALTGPREEQRYATPYGVSDQPVPYTISPI